MCTRTHIKRTMKLQDMHIHRMVIASELVLHGDDNQKSPGYPLRGPISGIYTINILV